MDIVSHGLWVNFMFRAAKQPRKIALIATFFGVAPDLFSFGLATFFRWTGLGALFGVPAITGDWGIGNVVVPRYIYSLYNVTHSLVVFGAVFLLVWLLRGRKWYWPLLGWAIHVLIDIPTHSTKFFPTPFLWPVANVQVNGIPWGEPAFFIPNVIALIGAFVWLYVREQRAQ
ncbi:MAG: hypothetical protein Q7S28_02435 [bacterium]|nr:hypothetical protein [bacterium]